jgi:DNA invertase Pin-like site-specific DNA recombinase
LCHSDAMTKSADAITRAVSYLRVSTDEQAQSGAGLDAQTVAIADAIGRRGWPLVATFTDEGVSGGVEPDARPGLAAALATLDAGHADALVVSKLDRLTRSVASIGPLVKRAQRGGWALVILDTDVDMTTAGGMLVVHMITSVAEWERMVIAERTRAALASRKRAGMRLGRPVTLAQDTRNRVAELRAAGMTMQAVADTLNAENVPTARGGKWHHSTVKGVLRSLELDAEALECVAV